MDGVCGLDGWLRWVDAWMDGVGGFGGCMQWVGRMGGWVGGIGGWVTLALHHCVFIYLHQLMVDIYVQPMPRQQCKVILTLMQSD